MKPRRRAVMKAMLGAIGALGILAPAAEAGRYWVYSCKTPTGAIAPTEGWTSEQVGGAFSTPSNGCNVGGSLTVQLNGDHPQPFGAQLGWRWTAPADTELFAVDLWRSVSTTNGADYNSTPMGWISRPTGGFGESIENCVAAWGCNSLGTHTVWNAAANHVWYGPDTLNGSKTVNASVACGGAPGWTCADRESTTPMADMRIHALKAALDDVTDPVPGPAAGSLVQAGVHRGTRSISFHATDTGAGIYRSLVEVKHAGETTFRPVSAEVIDANGGKCAEAGADPNTIYEFIHRVPCKLSAAASVDFDTTKVPDGVHELRVRVEDAASNRTTVHGPVRFEVDNVPPPAVVTEPTIAGAAKVGNTLVGMEGTWSGDNVTSTARWLRCVSAADLGTCSPIETGAGNQVELTNADLGYFIRYEVTATNREGSTKSASAPRGAVTTISGEIPACADGTDNDQDGKVDDADPGCSDRTDTSENTDGPACSNGLDDDGDGKIDADDRGCSDRLDTSENTDGPECSNGLDDDGDGRIDAIDPDCADASDTSETPPAAPPVTPEPTPTPTPSPTAEEKEGSNHPRPDSGQAVVTSPPTNGVNASNKAQITLTGSRRRSVRFGRSIATVVTLRDENGRPIVGARVTVLERMNTPGAAWVPAREPLVTDAEGKMRWLIPAKYSRTIRYAYKANLGNTDFQSTADVVLSVTAKTTMKAHRSFLRNGQTVRFIGRILSKPVPVGGVLIDLQAKVGGRWQTFKTTRARSSGRWTTGYTFRATRGLRTYAFRARVSQDSSFPYARAISRVVRVKVAG